MNYKESLLELIKSKKEISENNTIRLPLGEIADVWNRKNVFHSQSYEEPLFRFYEPLIGSKTRKVKRVYVDSNFLQDIALALKNIEDEGFITVSKPVMESEFCVPQDEIVLEVKDMGERYDEIKDWYNRENNSLSFRGEFYKPRSEEQAKFIRYLFMSHQKENKKGDVLEPGTRTSENELASEMGVGIKEIRNIKKQLKRCFGSKGFPLKIDSNAEGILLIYTI